MSPDSLLLGFVLIAFDFAAPALMLAMAVAVLVLIDLSHLPERIEAQVDGRQLQEARRLIARARLWRPWRLYCDVFRARIASIEEREEQARDILVGVREEIARRRLSDRKPRKAATLLHHIAKTYRGMQMYPEALDCIEEAIVCLPSLRRRSAKLQQVRNWNELGLIYCCLNKLEDAVMAFRQGTSFAVSPPAGRRITCGILWKNLGDALFDLDRYDEAVTPLENAWELLRCARMVPFPTLAQVAAVLADIGQRQGDLERWLENAIRALAVISIGGLEGNIDNAVSRLVLAAERWRQSEGLDVAAVSRHVDRRLKRIRLSGERMSRQNRAFLRDLLMGRRRQEVLAITRGSQKSQPGREAQGNALAMEARSLAHEGRVCQADSVFRQAVALLEAVDPLPMASLAVTYNNWALVHVRRGYLNTGERLLKRAQDYLGESGSGEDPLSETAKTVSNNLNYIENFRSSLQEHLRAQRRRYPGRQLECP